MSCALTDQFEGSKVKEQKTMIWQLITQEWNDTVSSNLVCRMASITGNIISWSKGQGHKGSTCLHTASCNCIRVTNGRQKLSDLVNMLSNGQMPRSWDQNGRRKSKLQENHTLCWPSKSCTFFSCCWCNSQCNYLWLWTSSVTSYLTTQVTDWSN